MFWRQTRFVDKQNLRTFLLNYLIISDIFPAQYVDNNFFVQIFVSDTSEVNSFKL